MKSESQIGHDKQPEVTAAMESSAKRRKLIRGGMVGVPVLLALKSTPVLAQNCKLPSGFSTSGNLSRNGGAACSEPANGPAYWKTHITGSNFTGTTVSKNAKFSDIFVPSGDTRKLIDILNTNIIDFTSLVIAAYIDTKTVPSSFIGNVSATDIQLMWNGSYQPVVGAPFWTAAQSENYLRYAMGLPLNP